MTKKEYVGISPVDSEHEIVKGVKLADEAELHRFTIVTTGEEWSAIYNRHGYEMFCTVREREDKMINTWNEMFKEDDLDTTDLIRVIRCMDCVYWEPCNAEEGDFSGHCRNNAECQGALTDATFFCGSAERNPD